MPEIRNNPNTGPATGTLCEGPRSPARCFPVKQRGLGCHHVTARKKWSKEVNIVVKECCFRSSPIDENVFLLKGIGKECTWNGRAREWFGPFCGATEQRICDQARAIRKNGWLMEVELEMIKRRIKITGPHETDQEEIQGVEDLNCFHDSDELVSRAELSISINEVSEEEITVVNELKEIYGLGEKR